MLQILQEQLAKSVDCLEFTPYQNEKLKESGMETVGHVLKCSEQDLIEKIYYVGEKRASSYQECGRGGCARVPVGLSVSGGM